MAEKDITPVFKESDNLFLRLDKAMKDVGCEIFRECIRGCCQRSEEEIKDDIINDKTREKYYKEEKRLVKKWNLNEFDIKLMYNILSYELHTKHQKRKNKNNKLKITLMHIKNERNELYHKTDEFTAELFGAKMKLYDKFYSLALDHAIDMTKKHLNEFETSQCGEEGYKTKKSSLDRMIVARNELREKMRRIFEAEIKFEGLGMQLNEYLPTDIPQAKLPIRVYDDIPTDIPHFEFQCGFIGEDPSMVKNCFRSVIEELEEEGEEVDYEYLQTLVNYIPPILRERAI